jgi:hypothetical protein
MAEAAGKLHHGGFVSESRHDSILCDSSLLQSNYKAKKIIFIFLVLDWNREFIILCSCHSIARARSRFVVGRYSW